MRTRLLKLAAAALVSAGCLNADLKADQVCATMTELIPGAPSGPIDNTFTITYDLADGFSNLDHSGVTGTVLVQQIQISTQASGVDLSTIDSVEATVLPSGSGSSLPPVPLACNYQPPTGVATPVTSLVVPCTDGNIFNYVKGQQLTMRLRVTASHLPAAAWLADVGTCFSVEVNVNYTQL
ncbi:MAG TPA: hypothetical protein VMT17_01995 [Anaeromyxobacteraceae bacterium]|nr:hypothetical protein [Anaeromyxobacteraceae bacterium]